MPPAAEKGSFDSQAAEDGDGARDDVAEEHASGGASEPHNPVGLGAVREVVRFAEGANEDPLGRQLGDESQVSISFLLFTPHFLSRSRECTVVNEDQVSQVV